MVLFTIIKSQFQTPNACGSYFFYNLKTLMATSLHQKLHKKHICAPTDGKYMVVKALELFRSASSMGFGKQVDRVVPTTNKKVTRFRKTPYPLLSTEEYNRTFPTTVLTTPLMPSPEL